MSAMNYSTAIFYINPKVRAVVGIYEPEATDAKPNPNNRTMFKTLDPDLKVGDLVMVPSTTRHNFTVFKLVEVDAQVDIDYAKVMQWVVGKIDMDAYEKIKAIEQAGIDKMKQHEAKKRQDAMFEAMGMTKADLVALPMAVVNEEGDIKKTRKA